jgi:hypothetical protein
VRSRLVHREDLSGQQRRAMLALLDSYFEGISPGQFRADLARKNWVVLVEDADRRGAPVRLAGFSTIRYDRTVYKGRRMGVVYSGDTIVDRSAWTSPALFRGWIESVRRLHAGAARDPLYWLLLVSGYRTYRLLPVLWREFFPRAGRRTPPEAQALLDHLAAERFGACYDRASGVVRFPRPQVLRDGLRNIPPGRMLDPDVAFFAAANPGHVRGDELVCLADLSEANLTRAGRRMAGTSEPAAAAAAT